MGFRIERAVARGVKGALRVGCDSVRYGATVGPRLVEVAILRSLRRTDYRRWTAPDSLETWWDARTRILAELVPAGSRVIEFGAGRVAGIEIKATAAPSEVDGRHLAWLRDELGDRFVTGVVLHTGPRPFRLAENIFAAPISTIWA